MIELSWSQLVGTDCLRLTGLEPEARVEIRPAGASHIGGAPPMAGRLVGRGSERCFVPRFGFVEGTTYALSLGGVVVGSLLRPRVDGHTTTKVLAIYPIVSEVPRNLLRFSVWFSAPMSEGCSTDHIALVDDGGDVIVGALLATEHELWDGDRRRLTILLDPARIKRGLVAHDQAGYPLQTGCAFRLRVDAEIPDAQGKALQASAERRYRVGEDERRRVDPSRWDLGIPTKHTTEPLCADFGRPLDPFLVGRCLGVRGLEGHAVQGAVEVGPGGRSWHFTPSAPWAPGSHRLVVDPVLEDLAGNSVARVFDRDLRTLGDTYEEPHPVELVFHPS